MNGKATKEEERLEEAKREDEDEERMGEDEERMGEEARRNIEQFLFEDFITSCNKVIRGLIRELLQKLGV